MKRNIFIAVLGMVAAGVAYGQGNILFSNYYNSKQSTGITYGSGPDAGLGVGNEISVELFYGASTVTQVSGLTGIASSITPVGYNGVTQPTALGQTSFGSYAGAGVFSGGNVLVPGTPGATYAFAIYASGTLGGVQYSGWSSIFTGPTQGSGTPLPTVPGLPTGLQMQTFSVTSVPEPATMALGGLGLASLLVMRRKKA